MYPITTLDSTSKALRWGALTLGLYYGYSRQSSLTLFVQDRQAAREKAAYEQLVAEGKLAFEQQYNNEQAALAAAEGGMSFYLTNSCSRFY